MEAQDCKFYTGNRTEINAVIAQLSDLSESAVIAEINDPFGPALVYIKDWVRGVER